MATNRKNDYGYNVNTVSPLDDCISYSEAMFFYYRKWVMAIDNSVSLHTFKQQLKSTYMRRFCESGTVI